MAAAMSLILSAESQGIRRGSSTILDRVARLVPVETISMYAVIAALAPGWRYLGLAAAACAVLAVAVLAAYGRRCGQRPRLTQHLVRVLAFVAWAFVLSNPLTPAAPVAPWLPALAVLLIPLVGAFMFPPAPPVDSNRRN
jgi:hypothetical protein